MPVIYDCASAALAKARTADATDASFPSKVPTTTAPTGAGVLDVAVDPAATTQRHLLLLPYGGDAENETFKLRVIGWKATTNGLWVPTILAELTCTLGTATGVDGSDVENEMFFADTLVLAAGYSSDAVRVTSPANNTVARALVDLEGHRKVEVTFDRNGSAASCNALYALL